MEDLINDWPKWAGLIAAAILLFDRIAKVTPTETDNRFLKTIHRIASVLGIKVKDNEGK